MAQPTPTAYSDFSKLAGDLLSKDFPAGTVKLEVNTTAPNGMTFTVNGTKDNKADTIQGELKAKWFDFKNGVTFSQGWTTSNLITGQIELENNVRKGLKLDINSSFHPVTNAKSGRVGVIFKQAGVHARGYFDITKSRTVTADTVLAREGCLLGLETVYDVVEGKVTRYSAAVGYAAPFYTVTLHANQGLNVFTTAYHHRVNPDLEAAGRMVYDTTKKEESLPVALEVGAKYFLDNGAYVKAKVNNTGILGLSFTQLLRPGVKVTLAGVFDTMRLNENAHKLGIGISVNA
ncbi:uncharacterized protein VTP21DRAFT_298 [Calcarisporiella thermophila]|uniref:uncharacterized protein n=1 Tax=Calcarisporiella thermophila TaxID=911321 RepID=UPI003742E42A